jgi:hypothetical protein
MMLRCIVSSTRERRLRFLGIAPPTVMIAPAATLNPKGVEGA